jgi:hypothetical protein
MGVLFVKLCKLREIRRLEGWKTRAKKLPLMKLLPNFCVFTYEARAKLHVAEEHHEQN